MIKKLYTFGCSFTKDNYQLTWADLLAKHLGLDLVNRAERGSGADYISSRLLMSDDILDSESLVAIMWPCADRFDLWADDSVPHLVHDQIHASWPDGQRPMLVDLHGEKSQHKGFILNGSVPRGYKHQYYKFFYSPYQTVHHWYKNIILTQIYLKSRGISNIMMSAFPLQYPIQYHHNYCAIESKILALIDLNQFLGPCLDLGFQPWCVENKLDFFDRHHPDTRAHEIWLQQFVFDRVEKIFYDCGSTK